MANPSEGMSMSITVSMSSEHECEYEFLRELDFYRNSSAYKIFFSNAALLRWGFYL